MPDRLSDQHSGVGAVVLNHGDPTYISGRSVASASSVDIFLRTISYVPFAETIILPGRHLLDGENAFEAALWARTLFREGLIVPERRHGAASFVQVAQDRGLGHREQARADFLDQHVVDVREFQWGELSSTYRSILIEDLGPTGAFRRVVSGGLQGALKSGLDRALEHYLLSEETTPEAFASSVLAGCPAAARLGRKWAMARYYLTPASFDDVHVRQIPDEAADLLIRGCAIDHSLRPPGDLPPAERLAQTVRVGLQLHEVRQTAEAYCDAALRVRADIPEARALFSKILSESETREIGEEVSSAMSRELQKQFRSKLVDHPLFSLGIDLLGAGIGAVIGSPGGVVGALTLGAAGVAATTGTKHVVRRRYDKKRRPWKLAIDRLDTAVRRIRP